MERLHYFFPDPHQWWSRTKRLLKLPDSNPFANLDRQDSPDKLAETINNFFVSVSAHLLEVAPDILAKPMFGDADGTRPIQCCVCMYSLAYNFYRLK